MLVLACFWLCSSRLLLAVLFSSAFGCALLSAFGCALLSAAGHALLPAVAQDLLSLL